MILRSGMMIEIKEYWCFFFHMLFNYLPQGEKLVSEQNA